MVAAQGQGIVVVSHHENFPLTFTTEPIHAMTDRALQEGQLPSPDAGDEHGQPLLTGRMFAALFGLTPEQAEAERTAFFPPIAEVACRGPIRPAGEEGTVNSRR